LALFWTTKERTFQHPRKAVVIQHEKGVHEEGNGMTSSSSRKFMNNQSVHNLFAKLYGEAAIKGQIDRYRALMDRHENRFGKADIRLFSTPGRTEIGGNHTDHNAGRVLAAAVDLDAIAAVSPNQSDIITILSEGYAEPFTIQLNDLTFKETEAGTTTALIRGIAARFKELGHVVGGFDATVESRVTVGSGLSSSAAFEVLVASILNGLFNHHRIGIEEIAQIGQFAENHYFGKPCGLMDQLTCSVGGVITIDFKEAGKPVFEKIQFDLDSRQFGILVVNTGGSHADLTQDYASVPAEMKSVAGQFGKNLCREITMEDLLGHLASLRAEVGDRAILRAYHFLCENERVLHQVNALRRGDFTAFLTLVRESGDSSFRWLQNAYSIHNPAEQGLSLALALAEHGLAGRAAAWRVHGGGFAGTIQIFVSGLEAIEISSLMTDVFGEGAVARLRIRSEGAIEIPLP
jgi:galactokinase